MAVTILNPSNSFVRFDETVSNHCLWPGLLDTCLPVYESEDVYFQFVLETDTEAEADALCGITNDIEVGIITDCEDPDFLLLFDEKPERYRTAPTQVLYNWSHGLPSFVGVIDIGQCFKLRVQLGEDQWCSNCFSRIGDDCFTSVIEYGNDENAFGFNYCGAGSIGGEDTLVCQPTYIEYIDQSEVVIPYTAFLQSQYGDVPNVQVWMYFGSVLQVVNVSITMDAVPPTLITIDMGGVGTGFIVIR